MEAQVTEKLKDNEERRKVITRVPLRIHELLGLPKSAGKTMELPKINRQPVRIKELLGSSTKEAPESSVPKSQPVRVKELLVSTEPNGKEKLPGYRNLGQGTSTGRNFPEYQPVRVKELLGSLDENGKSGNGKCEKPTVVGVGAKSVRRKLYSSSPVYGKQIVDRRKSAIATKNIREKNVDERPSRKSSTKTSLLRPPKTIRDRRTIDLRRNASTIFEETTLSLDPESEDIPRCVKNPPKICVKEKKSHLKNDNQDSVVREFSAQGETIVAPIVADGTEEKIMRGEPHVEIPRPSVIMGLSTLKKGSGSAIEKNGELCRLPTSECKQNRTIPLMRLDDRSFSREDSSGHSRLDAAIFQDLRNTATSSVSIARMDPQTRAWLHGNLKLCVQATEESLFTMKRMLKEIEDAETCIPERLSTTIIEGTTKAAGNPISNISGIEIVTGDRSSEKTRYPSVSSYDERISYGEVFSRDDGDDDDDENKENRVNGQPNDDESSECETAELRRRSARLAAIVTRSPKNSDGSFTRLETKLNITHGKCKTERKATPIKKTPAKRNIHLDARCNRSLREYMTLKSSTKFLQTPDHKGLQTPKGEKYGTPAQRRAIDRALSRTVLKQLNDLYDPSS